MLQTKTQNQIPAMSAEETKILASLHRLDNIDKLKGPSNYHVWKQQFEYELELMGIWRYIAEDYNPPVVGGTVTTESLKVWERAHKRICTMLKTRCEPYARSLIESETNAQKAWKILERNKPRGSGTANSTFKKFESLTLSGCNDDPQTYANTFKKVARDFQVLSPKLAFNEVWLIYHFHAGLGPVYNAYCEEYSQTHDSFDDNGDAKFTLDYAVTRFINYITDPTVSVETRALAALVNGTFAHTPHSVIALVAAGRAEITIQPGAHAGNSRTYTQTCKYCTHCKKDWHDDSECTTLHPHLKSRRKNNRFGG